MSKEDITLKNRTIDIVNRAVEIEMEVDSQPLRYPSFIITIEPDTVEVFSPVENDQVIEVPFGTEIILHEKPIGKPPEQYKLTALAEGWNDELEASVLILAQPDPLLEPNEKRVQLRELAYESVSIPVWLKQVPSDKADAEEVFETQSVNISGSGILVKLAESEGRSLMRGDQVIAEFCVEFQEITREFRLVGNVVREFSKSESEGDFRFVALSFNTPEFDKQDREDLIEFVLDLQIANYTQSRMGE